MLPRNIFQPPPNILSSKLFPFTISTPTFDNHDRRVVVVWIHCHYIPSAANMKIIDPSRQARKPLDRNQFLDLEIDRLQEEIGVKERIGIPLPINLKAKYLEVLENFANVHGKIKEAQENTQLQQSLQSREFTCFNDLPVELRLKIWGYAFASDTQPRIHCIDIVNAGSDRETFISNQPVSSILHANHESRSHYFRNTDLQFAFETFLNFDTDIFYIADFADRESSFRKFLNFDDADGIQKLAMRKDSFCDIPLTGHFSSKHAEMLYNLSGWKEMFVVFEDERPWEEVWKDTSVVFRDFTAREKRKRAERSYTRKWCKTLNEFMESYDEPAIKFRFGRLERGEDCVDPVEASSILELESLSV
ncbi:hypothetical protein L207DRAFT_520865 [Hyaloscypha variabilis F]|uniref:2EXR domain-containing protein n=1 Tax=Hyaloscypha variabilis (strain UAMH 11265 / GT02V1 / F) TaxID=1149755 RepID=A0A2J6QTI1_HYAVF|nr:hypothetical protein L207DRAFT_520865 [Hyaloscypha variabilis F]